MPKPQFESMLLDDGGNVVGWIVDGAVKRLPMDGKVKVVGGIGGATGQWHWDSWTTGQAVTDASWVDVYSNATVDSVIYGLVFHTSTNEMLMRIELDATVILDLDLQEIFEDFKLEPGPGSGNDDGSSWGAHPPFISAYNDNRWRFKPPEPMSFATSFKVQLKAKAGTKTLERGITTWREP